MTRIEAIAALARFKLGPPLDHFEFDVVLMRTGGKLPIDCLQARWRARPRHTRPPAVASQSVYVAMKPAPPEFFATMGQSVIYKMGPPEVTPEADGRAGFIANHAIALEGMTEDLLFLEARQAVLRALGHELDESILIDGKRVFDPHAGELA